MGRSPPDGGPGQPLDAPSDELTAVIGDPFARVGTWALMALIGTNIFILVMKPLV